MFGLSLQKEFYYFHRLGTQPESHERMLDKIEDIVLFQ